jgi:hypothetical protein
MSLALTDVTRYARIKKPCDKKQFQHFIPEQLIEKFTILLNEKQPE